MQKKLKKVKDFLILKNFASKFAFFTRSHVFSTFLFFCRCTPTSFKKFYIELEKLSYRDKIDYELFLHVIKECIPEGVNEFTPYDWEEAPTQLSDS